MRFITSTLPARAMRLRSLSSTSVRLYATTGVGPGNPSFQVFDRNLKRMQRDRAAMDPEKSRKVDYIKAHVANQLVDRMLFINRPFHNILDLGSGPGYFAAALAHAKKIALENDEKKISSLFSRIVMTDMSPTMLLRDEDQEFNNTFTISREIMDEEVVDYAEDTFDAVVSNLSMQWINDLPGALGRIKDILKPDAPFIGVMFGGDTLFELRTSIQLAEQERRGGVSPRVSPMAEVRDIGGLLQKAGFNLLTVDVDDMIVDYPDIYSLMEDLQAMGESNAVLGREIGPIGRDVLIAADAIYKALHGNEDGTIPATFRMIFMIGWKPSPNQSKPLARGSAERSMKEALEKMTKPDIESVRESTPVQYRGMTVIKEPSKANKRDWSQVKRSKAFLEEKERITKRKAAETRERQLELKRSKEIREGRWKEDDGRDDEGGNDKSL